MLEWQDTVLVGEESVCTTLSLLAEPAEVCVTDYVLCCLGVDERVIK